MAWIGYPFHIFRQHLHSFTFFLYFAMQSDKLKLEVNILALELTDFLIHQAYSRIFFFITDMKHLLSLFTLLYANFFTGSAYQNTWETPFEPYMLELQNIKI